ncbi:TonB-dependent receptor-like protein [Mucilaginibacter frigoritolerans]|uniref:TonB-dependent receptor-like protein n=1 Tax=Mucilaginibacter frigoritolerans TaxID=652788 RepID=A0A562TT39_9SPHI|nr:carboxypeptidase-like regulatory domain-containing protein [Mucilaginibacter frigoritolerans]TWI95950.1 TonB-dependent receptor-like protein [Mucilaginibacter frigoritolerans]
MKKRIPLFIFSILITTLTYAQTDSLILKHHIDALEQYAENNPAEKVHLHLNSPWYGLGDTIWFKAYTVIGNHHQPSTLSGILYAELINGGDTVVQRLILPLHLGMANGDFVVPYTYKSGTYRLRAYTNWMRNDSAYYYDELINIGGLAAFPTAVKAQTILPLNNSASSNITDIDVQFFPEGGYLVNGLRSKVAFKAINSAGISENIQGSVTDQDGNEIASFTSQHAGMGQFALLPEPGKQYKAKITTTNGSTFTVNLPQAQDSGFTLTINNAADSIYVKVAANQTYFNSNQNAPFYLLAQAGGKCYYSGSGKLLNPVFTTVLDKARFPSGIVQFTLFSQTGEPLNERVVFIKKAAELSLALSTHMQSYEPRDSVSISLEAKKADIKGVVGSFSVSVTDETDIPVDEQAEYTIFTDLLLTQELKGHIENPNYYFINNNDQARTDLDLLMLTQGYHRFEWKKILAGKIEEPIFKPETSLSLLGIVKTQSNKPVPNGMVRLTSIKDFFSADTLTDASGNFTFKNVNLPDSTKAIINARKINGGRNVKIIIRETQYPSVNKRNKQTANAVSATTPESVLAAMKKTYTEEQQRGLKNVIQLKQVEVKSKKNEFFDPTLSDNMKFSGNLNGPGNADQVFLGSKLIGCAKLSECLQGRLFSVIWRNGLPYSLHTTRLRGGGPMAIMIDGAQASPNDLDDINPDDVYAIEVLTSISYLSIYGSSAPNGALLITLKHGAGAADNVHYPVDGLVTYKFKGYYKEREFYSPRYESKNTSTVADIRKAIYWNPNIITDANGKASFGYFNAGSKGTYRVVIEGIDGEGNLGRQVLRYEVK